jgi:hypothetical protein
VAVAVEVHLEDDETLAKHVRQLTKHVFSRVCCL